MPEGLDQSPMTDAELMRLRGPWRCRSCRFATECLLDRCEPCAITRGKQ